MTYIVLVILNILLSVIQFSVIIECVCSWLPELSGSAFYEAIYNFNGIFLNPIRKVMQRFSGGLPIDLSPIILFLLISLIRGII